MTSETTTNKLNSNNMHECEHCGKQFTRERTLMVHVCEQKRRHLQRDEKGVQVGYLAYNRFFQLAQGSTKNKTYQHFAKSPYYIAFCKFGRYVISRTIIEADTYIDWLITQNVGIDAWAKEGTYDTYLQSKLLTEPVEPALERTIKSMQEWAHNESAEWKHFFYYVNINRAVEMINQGKISPWVIFNCESGQKLLGDMNDEQIQLIATVIDPPWWKKVFKSKPTDVDFAKEVLRTAGIE